jgi:hypothetical protein
LHAARAAESSRISRGTRQISPSYKPYRKLTFPNSKRCHGVRGEVALFLSKRCRLAQGASKGFNKLRIVCLTVNHVRVWKRRLNSGERSDASAHFRMAACGIRNIVGLPNPGDIVLYDFRDGSRESPTSANRPLRILQVWPSKATHSITDLNKKPNVLVCLVNNCLICICVLEHRV